MSDLAIARRYALALSESAGEKNRADRVDEDVDLVRLSLDGSPDLERFFQSPIVSRAKKVAVIRTLFSERIDDVTLDPGDVIRLGRIGFQTERGEYLAQKQPGAVRAADKIGVLALPAETRERGQRLFH